MLVPTIKKNDWVGVKKAIQLLSSKLDYDTTRTFEELSVTGLTATRLVQSNASDKLTSVSDLTSWIAGTSNQITVTDDADGTVTLSITAPLAVPGKVTAGSFASPTDVTATRQYGFELHYSGNDYDVTGLRSRAQLVTTDTTATAQGALLQAANNDNINVGVLNGALIEAIGKATTNAATISMMRGCLINTEWSAKDTVTDLRILHVRTHTRDAVTEGYISGTGYGVYIENEAVGGNGQALDAGIYFKGTNLSAGNKAFTYGIDFSGGTFASEEIKLANGSIIGSDKVTLAPTTDSTTFFQVMDADGGTPVFNVDTTNERVGIGINTGLDPRGGLTVLGDIDILHTASISDDHAFEIDLDAAGYGDVKAIDIDYITGAISAGKDEGIILINIDEIAATGGDVFGLEVLATEGSAGIYGMKVGAVIGPIHHDSGTFVNPSIGTNDTPTTAVPEMIDGDSGPTERTSIFVALNDYIIIGKDAVFEEIEFIITTGSSGAGIKPKFEYSTGGSGFTEFFPVDGTNGFRNTGVVAWDALVGHAVNADTGAANTYDIRITRERTNLSTTPILGYAKTAATTEYLWDKNGDVNINSLTLATIAAEASDVDKFLVSSSGVIKYRTGAQVLSDIGPSGFSSKCSVYRNALQAITHQTWTKIELNTEDYDTDSEFDSVTNYRFEPDTTGYYNISAAASIAALDDGKYIRIAIYKNGTAWKSDINVAGVSGVSHTVNVVCNMYLLDTDYIELWVYHDHGSNRNIGSTTNRYTFMDVHRVA